jgi:hypothetical protein
LVTELGSCFVFSLSLEKNRSRAWRDQVERGENVIGKKLKRLASSSYCIGDETSLEYHLIAKNYHSKEQHYK